MDHAYRAKHMPLSAEFAAALEFIGGLLSFAECPEFDFESCWWRFASCREDVSGVFGRNTEYVHRAFDAHAAHFSPVSKRSYQPIRNSKSTVQFLEDWHAYFTG